MLPLQLELLFIWLDVKEAFNAASLVPALIAVVFLTGHGVYAALGEAWCPCTCAEFESFSIWCHRCCFSFRRSCRIGKDAWLNIGETVYSLSPCSQNLWWDACWLLYFLSTIRSSAQCFSSDMLSCVVITFFILFFLRAFLLLILAVSFHQKLPTAHNPLSPCHSR